MPGDNFWQMGETGPCGPCTEVHGVQRGCVEGSPVRIILGMNRTPDGLGWMEIWNVVFTQFERSVDPSGPYRLDRLPSRASTRVLGSSAWRACSKA